MFFAGLGPDVQLLVASYLVGLRELSAFGAVSRSLAGSVASPRLQSFAARAVGTALRCAPPVAGHVVSARKTTDLSLLLERRSAHGGWTAPMLTVERVCALVFDEGFMVQLDRFARDHQSLEGATLGELLFDKWRDVRESNLGPPRVRVAHWGTVGAENPPFARLHWNAIEPSGHLALGASVVFRPPPPPAPSVPEIQWDFLMTTDRPDCECGDYAGFDGVVRLWVRDGARSWLQESVSPRFSLGFTTNWNSSSSELAAHLSSFAGLDSATAIRERGVSLRVAFLAWGGPYACTTQAQSEERFLAMEKQTNR